MANVTPGKTFVSGETVTPASLNAAATPTVVVADGEVTTAKIVDANVTDAKLATGAVTGAAGGGKLAASAITGQTAVTSLAGTDEFLVWDASASALRRVDWAAMQPSGTVLQTKYVDTTSRTTITELIPNDDTIPQITEGREILSVSITPSSTSNKILITSVAYLAHSANWGTLSCVFRSGTNSALAVAASRPSGGSNTNDHTKSLIYLDSPNTDSARTYSLRVGSHVSGTLLNQFHNETPRYGQIMRTMLMVQEIKA